jgi:CO/xanthine dehydrogenase Mo-binding subunit
MQTYIIPTMLDIPELDVDFVEFPYEYAWPGAKGVGEIPMDGLAPAIANAVKQATGVRFRRIPIRPEDLFEALVETGTLPAGDGSASGGTPDT